jgi:HlyD family secretion protein
MVVVVTAGAGRMLLGGRGRTPAHEFVTARAQRGDLRIAVTATGAVEAVKTIDVGAEVTGRVVELPVDYNDPVHRGQALAVIDPEPLKAAADQARAQVLAARAALRQADATAVEQRAAATRTRGLADQQLVARQTLEGAEATAARAEASLASARANLDLAEAALAQARTHLEKSTIRCPIDGIVLARLVEPGQTITAGFTTPVMFRIAEDLSRIQLKVDIDEADVGRVRVGNDATFTVAAYPDRTFSARIVSLRNDPRTVQNVVTYEAILSAENPQLMLKPGMTATTTIVTKVVHNALVVPDAALRFLPPGAKPSPTGPGWKTVWTHATGRDGEPRAIAVRTGASDGATTEIVDGALAVGDTVLVDIEDAP